MTEINMSVDQIIEEPSTVNIAEKNPDVVSGDATVDHRVENLISARLTALKDYLRKAVESKDPVAIANLEQEIKELSEDPQAKKIAEEFLKEKLSKKDQFPAQSDDPNSPIQVGEQQKDLDQTIDELNQIAEGGELKIVDVIASLETCKSALEEVGDTDVPMDSPVQSVNENDEVSKIIQVDKASELDEKKQEILQETMAILSKDPLVGTIVGVIGPNPGVLGSFITVLNAMKSGQGQTSEGREATISTAQFLMLSFLFG